MNLEKLKIEITDQCPLQCKHCSTNAGPEYNDVLSLETIEQIINEFYELGGKKITISGGEPLLHPQLEQILKHSKHLGLEIVLYSTGILLENKLPIKAEIRIFSNLEKYISKIIFSIYSDNSKTHDSITNVQGSYNLTWDSIKNSTELGIDTELHFVPTPLNYKSIPSVLNKMRIERIKKISLLRFVPQGRGEFHKDEMTFNKLQLIELKKIIEDCRTNNKNIEIRTGSPFNILLPEKISPCMAGINQLFITSNGNIFPCDAFKQYTFGIPKLSNIKEDSLKEIWEFSPFLLKTREALQTQLNKKCDSCESLDVCQSGCLAQKVISNSSFSQRPDPDCLFN